MRHLTETDLARLVDEPPEPEEREHLESCPSCADELEALGEQRDALATMPALRPPPDGWDDLEERLRTEALLGHRPSRTRASSWMRAAAAVVLFVGGAAVGVAADRAVGRTPDVAEGPAGAPTELAEDAGGVDGAAERLMAAEERYVDALIDYRRLAGESDDATDPARRFAALDALVAASRAGLREVPADRFLNGVLAGAVAERQATLRTIASDDWY